MRMAVPVLHMPPPLPPAELPLKVQSVRLAVPLFHAAAGVGQVQPVRLAVAPAIRQAAAGVVARGAVGQVGRCRN